MDHADSTLERGAEPFRHTLAGTDAGFGAGGMAAQGEESEAKLFGMGDPPPTPLGFTPYPPGLHRKATPRYARPRRIPATESTLGLRPRRALSFAQMQPV